MTVGESEMAALEGEDARSGKDVRLHARPSMLAGGRGEPAEQRIELLLFATVQQLKYSLEIVFAIAVSHL